MTNSAKRKGDNAEREFVKWARENGYPNAERIRAGWEDDRGDIDGMHGLVIEVKSAKALRINDWLDELRVECGNAGGIAHPADGWLVVRRPGQTDPGDWWAIRRVRDAL